MWFSFEIQHVRLAKRMMQQFVGEPLENLLDKYDTLYEEFSNYPIYFNTVHGTHKIKPLLNVSNITIQKVKHATLLSKYNTEGSHFVIHLHLNMFLVRVIENT